ncbi:outer membrane beta-barrel protein [Flavobacterium selenitireducens]|uniref:outer membrane beta-barrel protein n=1 Tax=Flavobacterium selenitireducens TaxID=2722704 RepID=UPI00168A7FB9|nr:outer membrane beta-barrel protein [Flavobacterium selenitireducens]MBD3583558.1 PorT family protein [Flavobacterium selenitireducens]
MKSNSKLNGLIVALALAGAIEVNAQQSAGSRHELSIVAGGVTSSLDYDLNAANSKEGIGGSAGLEYTYYFSGNFGVSLGAEYSLFTAKTKLESLSGAYNTVDFEQESFEFRYKMENVREKQTIGFVTIPVMLTYLNNANGFYIKAGGKIGLPVNSKFSSRFNLSTSGYYPQYNVELMDPAFMGFGTFDGINASGNDIETEINYIASVELGVKLPIGKDNVYAGFYFDYGLTDISKTTGQPVGYRTSPDGVAFAYNSLLNSGYADEVRTLSYGLKLRYAFSL